jgi:hypothetical protein
VAFLLRVGYNIEARLLLCLNFMSDKFIIPLTLVLTIFSASLVLAHEVETDHNLSALMHIEPNDHPVVGQEAKFFFTFKGDHEKFDQADCSCTFAIFKAGKNVWSGPAYVDHQDQSLLVDGPAFRFVFPEAGQYKVDLIGQPKSGANFTSFTLSYEVEVSEDQKTENHHGDANHKGLWSQHGFHIVIFGGVFIFLVIYLIYDYRKTGKWRKD